MSIEIVSRHDSQGLYRRELLRILALKLRLQKECANINRTRQTFKFVC